MRASHVCMGAAAKETALGWSGKGVKSCGNMIVAIPWMFRGWKEARQERKEAKSVERYEKQKQKLEAKMAKREGGKEKAKDDESEAEAS